MTYKPGDDPIQAAKNAITYTYPEADTAQAFALIAIAEELRTANLIAFYGANPDPDDADHLAERLYLPAGVIR